jgi:hypothetical protein
LFSTVPLFLNLSKNSFYGQIELDTNPVSDPDLKGTDVGGDTTGSAGRLSAPGMGEGAAESRELTLCPSEPESLANFT